MEMNCTRVPVPTRSNSGIGITRKGTIKDNENTIPVQVPEYCRFCIDDYWKIMKPNEAF